MTVCVCIYECVNVRGSGLSLPPWSLDTIRAMFLQALAPITFCPQRLAANTACLCYHTRGAGRTPFGTPGCLFPGHLNSIYQPAVCIFAAELELLWRYRVCQRQVKYRDSPGYFVMLYVAYRHFAKCRNLRGVLHLLQSHHMTAPEAR
jgi:hypothetical protein